MNHFLSETVAQSLELCSSCESPVLRTGSFSSASLGRDSSYIPSLRIQGAEGSSLPGAQDLKKEGFCPRPHNHSGLHSPLPPPLDLKISWTLSDQQPSSTVDFPRLNLAKGQLLIPHFFCTQGFLTVIGFSKASYQKPTDRAHTLTCIGDC